MKVTWERFWRTSMGLALPVALGSALLDQHVLATLMGLWDDLTMPRLIFFLSSGFLLLGLARNSMRLRELTDGRVSDPVRHARDREDRRPRP